MSNASASNSTKSNPSSTSKNQTIFEMTNKKITNIFDFGLLAKTNQKI